VLTFTDRDVDGSSFGGRLFSPTFFFNCKNVYN